MKKFFITLLVLLGIAAVGVVTCPDKQAHKDAIMSLFNSKLNQELSGEDDGVAIFGAAIGSRIIEVVIDNRLDVKNYFVFSLGQLEKDGGPQTISIGVLGHVFTTSKEEFSKSFDEAAEELL